MHAGWSRRRRTVSAGRAPRRAEGDRPPQHPHRHCPQRWREGGELGHDYATVGLTLRSHPLALLRPALARRQLARAADLEDVPDGRFVRCAGIGTVRRQPEAANGTIFVSLEAETGNVQVTVWKSLREKQRPEVLRSRLAAVYGKWQREGDVKNLVAHRLADLTPLLGRLGTTSRDFR